MNFIRFLFVFILAAGCVGCNSRPDINQLIGIGSSGLSDDEILSKLTKFVNDGGDLSQVIHNNKYNQSSVLHQLVDHDSPKIFRFILENGADKIINLSTEGKDQPCITALWRIESSRVAKVLLEYGASVTLKCPAFNNFTLLEKHRRDNPDVASVIEEFVGAIDLRRWIDTFFSE